MPELPEVETVKETLKSHVLNKTILDVEIRYDKIVDNIDVLSFKDKLKNNKIVDLKRKGKYIIFVLSNGYLISHLRMEGKYFYNSNKDSKHTHMIFNFVDNTYLCYNDVRKFGRFYYFDKSQDIYQINPLNKLGKEPFELENGSYLYQKIHPLNKPIKAILLDQSILAGIGNIYADEILFASKISPFKNTCKVTKKECDMIITEAKRILTEAIELGGSTIKSYQSEHGINGKFQAKLHVYARQGLPCDRCNTIIIKDRLDNRGTHYCPKCQKG